MFIGIDLGTTNSALAVFDGDSVSMIPNASGETLTPSVVRIDARGVETVGRRAKNSLESDPTATRAEWKRLMGTAERLRFEAAGRAHLPEELSARVIASLLGDARDALGFAPRAAVISTPALFELPQNHATVAAGKLAGLTEVVLIQEPIASAIAAGWRSDAEGTWMVFDLGGGTLDVSLLETKDGRLRVVDHAGDNFLGGKDIDEALLDWALGEIACRAGLVQLNRANPRARRSLARLRVACEQAKIDLSRANEAVISVPELAAGSERDPVDIDLVLTRAQLDGLVTPLLERSANVIRTLLAKNHCAEADVRRVVLVGGPTFMPVVRQRIGDLFDGRVAEGIDPMTIVARGAALYAGTTGLDARPRVSSATARSGLALRIEHPAVTADREPFVVGRFLPTAGQVLPASVRITRIENSPLASLGDASQGPAVDVSPEGSFVTQVRLERGRQNHFHLSAVNETGRQVLLATDSFAIVHGVSIADPPLSRSVGVASADDLVQIYFPKGTPLPARKTLVHRTAKAVSAKNHEDALGIPVVQGESSRAHRSRLIGMLQVRGAREDLPAGSRIEVTLQLDRSGQLHARADIPALGQTFEEIVHLLVPSATLETLAQELDAAHQRVEVVQRRAFEAGASQAVALMSGVAGLLFEAARSLPTARAGDADAAQKLHRLLLDAATALDDAEAVLEWPDLENEARRSALYYTPLVAAWGTPAEQQLFDQVLQAATAAEKSRNAYELERHLEAMRAVGRAAYCRNPRTLSSELEWVASHVTEATDVARANRLIERARAADSEGNTITLRTLVVEIWSLFPAAPDLQQKSFGSGVR